ncbi:MAG: type II toxin-antitoxin system RelE/ParE family toxin [Acidobacteriota bacterium]|jgi:mRNA-degrading endonuclease RelE of RelBE toxin-antitoxin system|nr:type II toxin-antitoxin system RelE/ParE family toxin [Acidobacteriota bacterium]
MIHIEWTDLAFNELESLSQEIAFKIIRQTDLLKTFPEMGVLLETENSKIIELRQIILKRKWRVIYDFNDYEKIIYILAVQNCRQQIPSMRDLHRRKRKIDQIK